jgi:hypothetical protein
VHGKGKFTALILCSAKAAGSPVDAKAARCTQREGNDQRSPYYSSCDLVSLATRDMRLAFERESGGRSTILNPELRINPLKMFSHSRGGDAEDRTNLSVGLSAVDPE